MLELVRLVFSGGVETAAVNLAFLEGIPCCRAVGGTIDYQQNGSVFGRCVEESTRAAHRGPQSVRVFDLVFRKGKDR
jgi:hypothetical protein